MVPIADRVISYDFRGNFTNLTAGLAAGGKSVAAFGTKLTALDANGAKMRAGLSTIGTAAGKMGLAAAAGLGAVVLVTAKFDKAMSNVAATGQDARDSFDELRQAAINAGAETAFSASEAAAGIENLLKAGVSAADVLGGGLSGALDLAAAGGLEVADAAEIAATAMTQFSLSGQDVGHVADLLAAGAGKAQGDVSDMGMALKQSGLVAAQVGLTIEETTGTLAAFASAGLIGSDAGTSFKVMLQSLTPTGAKARETMAELGITAYDAQGNFVGMTEFADSLRNGLKDLSVEQQNAAMKTIFGSDAVRAAAVIFDQGADGVQKWIDNVNDSGYAAEVAGQKLDNLAGDWEELTGSIETALIGSGEGATAPLRELVQGLTDVVNAFSALPAPAQGAATALLSVTAALGGTVFVGSRVVSGMATTREALINMGASATGAARATSIMSKTMGAVAGLGVAALGRETAKTNKALGAVMTTAGLAAAGFAVGGPWGAGLGAAIGLVVGLGTASDETAGQVDAFTAALDKQTGALTEVNRELAIKTLTDSGALDAAQDLGLNLATVTDAALGNASAIAAVNEALDGYSTRIAGTNTGRGGGTTGYDQEAAAVVAVKTAISDTNDVVDLSSEKWRQNAEAQGDATDATGGLTGATAELAGATGGLTDAEKDAAKALRDSVKAMRAKTDATLAAFDAETAYRLALKEAEAQGRRNSAGIKGNSEAALNNRNALSQLASAWNNQSEAVKNNGARFRESRKAFIDTATAMGVPEKAAKRLADQILDIPKSRAIKIAAETAAANAAIEETKRRLAYLNGMKATVSIVTMRSTVGTGVGPAYKAEGGQVFGPGTTTSDSVPAMLSNKEYVVKAAAVDHYGVDFFHRANAMRLAGGGYAGTGSNGFRASTGDNWSGGMGDNWSSGVRAFNDDLALTGVFLRNELKARQALLTKEVEANKSRLEAIKAEAAALKESVANRFQSDIWAKRDQIQLTRPEGFNEWDPEQQRKFLETEYQINQSMGGNNPNDILRADIAAAKKLMADLQELRRRGLDGAALANVATNADPGQIAALLSGSNAQLAEFEQLYGTRQRVSQQAGQSAVNLTGLTAEMRQARVEFRESNMELKQLNRRMERIEKLQEKNPRETGREVGAAVNNAAANGHKNRRP